MCPATGLPSPRQGLGEGGIRTLGSLLGYGALAKRCFRPLSHLTKICSHGTCHLPSLRGFGMASRRVATDASREYREESGFSNLQFALANTDLGRVLAISSELPIADC